MMASSKSLTDSGEMKYYFALSGFADGDHLAHVVQKIQSLGSMFLMTYHPKCTHVVCAKLTRSEKFLSACAQGKWIVTPAFVEDSYAQHKWLSEAPYEWNENMIPRKEICSRALLDLYRAPRKNRLKVAKSGQKGLFHNWSAILLLKNYPNQLVYKRILKAGGAALLITQSCLLNPRMIRSESAFVFIDKENETNLRTLLRQQVLCLYTDYIRNFILQEREPDPKDFLFGNYIPDSDCYFKITTTPVKQMPRPLKRTKETKGTRKISPKRSKTLKVLVSPRKEKGWKQTSICNYVNISPIVQSDNKKQSVSVSASSEPKYMDKFLISVPQFEVENQKEEKMESANCLAISSKMFYNKKNVGVEKSHVCATSSPLKIKSQNTFEAAQPASSSCKFERAHKEILFNPSSGAMKTRGTRAKKTDKEKRLKNCEDPREACKRKLYDNSDQIRTRKMTSSMKEQANDDVVMMDDRTCEDVTIASDPIFDETVAKDEFAAYCKMAISNQSLSQIDYFKKWKSLQKENEFADVTCRELPQRFQIIYESTVEQEMWHDALRLLKQFITPSCYPSAKIMHSIMRIVQSNTNDFTVRESYDFLLQILLWHPPTTCVKREWYHKILNIDETLNSWNYIHDLIKNCLGNSERNKSSKPPSMLLLNFIKILLEEDFITFISRSEDPTRDLSVRNRQPLIVQILWTVNEQKKIDFNCRCAQLVKFLIANVAQQNKFEVIMILQKLVAMMMECLNISKTLYKAFPPSYPAGAITAAHEIASSIIGANLNVDAVHLLLSTLELPWAKMMVSEQLLKHRQGFTASNCDSNVSLNLKSIVSQYMNKPPMKDAHSHLSSIVFEKKAKESHQFVLANSNGNLKISSPHKKNIKGETPLHLACQRNQVARLRHLLCCPNIDVNAQDNAGWTPLHEACNFGFVECVKELLQYQPDLMSCKSMAVDVQARGMYGITPLHDAVNNNHFEVVELLLKYGGTRLLKIKNDLGYTPDKAATEKMLQLLKSFETPSKESNCKDSELQSFEMLHRHTIELYHLLANYIQMYRISDIYALAKSYEPARPHHEVSDNGHCQNSAPSECLNEVKLDHPKLRLIEDCLVYRDLEQHIQTYSDYVQSLSSENDLPRLNSLLLAMSFYFKF